jgi:hypothetical protein
MVATFAPLRDADLDLDLEDFLYPTWASDAAEHAASER